MKTMVKKQVKNLLKKELKQEIKKHIKLYKKKERKENKNKTVSSWIVSYLEVWNSRYLEERELHSHLSEYSRLPSSPFDTIRQSYLNTDMKTYDDFVTHRHQFLMIQEGFKASFWAELLGFYRSSLKW